MEGVRTYDGVSSRHHLHEQWAKVSGFALSHGAENNVFHSVILRKYFTLCYIIILRKYCTGRSIMLLRKYFTVRYTELLRKYCTVHHEIVEVIMCDTWRYCEFIILRYTEVLRKYCYAVIILPKYCAMWWIRYCATLWCESSVLFTSLYYGSTVYCTL